MPKSRTFRHLLGIVLDPAHRTVMVVSVSVLVILLSIVMINCFHPGEPSGHTASSASQSLTTTPSASGQEELDSTGKQEKVRPHQADKSGPDKNSQGQPDHPTTNHPVRWLEPSQSSPYPDPDKVPNMELVVSIKDQRVYVRSGSTTLYTMFASTGMDDSTPRGKFAIEPEKGEYFFNAQEGMGAHYYTSFLNHGVFLFHSVPTDADRTYIVDQANLLGIRPSSHGCIRLTLPDARWIMEEVPAGTPVEIS